MNISLKSDLWTYLSNTDKPIFLYGTGDGADKIISALQSYGREPDGYFASDGFVRGQSFRGKRVMSLSEIKQQYTEFIILQSFGTCLPDVLKTIEILDAEYEYYAPDVPLYGGELFTYEYYLSHKKQIDAVYDMLADDRSRKVYKDIIEYKLSGKLSYLNNSWDEYESTLRSIFTEDYEYYCDGGAYRGESSLQASRLFPGLDKIYAFEPDPNAYKKLSGITLDRNINFECYNAMLSDNNEKVKFYNRKNRSSSANPLGSDRTDSKYIEIDSLSLDGIITDTSKGLIKLDVEGQELESLRGSAKLIRNGADLQISLYHRSCDIFSIPLYLKHICKNARFYIRRIPYIPAWDVYLSVIQK